MKKKGRFVSDKKKCSVSIMTVVLSCILGMLALLAFAMIIIFPSLLDREETVQVELPSTTQTEETQVTESTLVYQLLPPDHPQMATGLLPIPFSAAQSHL